MTRQRRYFGLRFNAGGLVVLAGLFATAVGAFATGFITERFYLSDLTERTRLELDSHTVSLEGFLDKYRILPPLIARHPDVITSFRDGFDVAGLATAQQIVETTTGMTGADGMLFVRIDGTVLVANRPGRPSPGDSIATMPHFKAAMQGRLGRHLEFDEIEKRGYYLFAAPVRNGDEIIGVVVARVALENVEQAWALSKDPVIITDPAGTVVVANRRNWRGRNLRKPTISTSGHRAAEVPPVITAPEEREGPFSFVRLADEKGVQKRYLEETAFLPLYGWRLRVYADTALARAQMINMVLAALLVGLIATAVVGLLVERRRRLAQQMRVDRAASLRLERRVRDRTRELTHSNKRLAEEVGEREATEEELRRTQSELIQAAKLAALGQMSAALSHEFNQPLAAIRSYADNATLLIDRDRKTDASQNLQRITALVDRLAGLSRHLKTFARKPGTTTRPVPVAPVIGETLMLLSPRLNKAGIDVDVIYDDKDVVVDAGQVRLEQVVMNLIGNAADAVAERPDPMVAVRVGRDDDHGLIEVCDNGPGVAEDVLPNVFDPFYTTKDVGEGLGLGLSIAYKIVRDFKGTIGAANRPKGGAVFTVRLPLAEPVHRAAE